MMALNKFPSDLQSVSKVLIVNFGEKELPYCMRCAALLRDSGIATEIYPESAKMKKQMGYADAKKIPYVALVGENEIAENKINLKNMTSGEQTLVSTEELIKQLTIIA